MPVQDTQNILDRFSLGGVESNPDYRDIPLSAVFGIESYFPSFYFIDVAKLPIWHQKKLGSCVGQASGKYKQKFELNETGSIVNLSPRFIYAKAKTEDGLPKGMEGTYYRLGVKVLQKYGCLTEDIFPNNSDISHDEYIDISKLTEADYKKALKYAIKSYASVGLSEAELKSAIMQSNGVLLGMKLGKEWWTKKDGQISWLEADILPLRAPASIVSGHAIYLYGWDSVNSRTRFFFRNSWSEEWGQKGNGYFFYDEQKDFLTEAWTAVDLPNDWVKEAKDLPPAEKFKHFFSFDVSFGQRNSEVRKVQIALKILGFFPKTVSETGYYGEITRKAVFDFQTAYKVASLSELLFVRGRRVGVKTRNKLNELFL